jgi:imidazolonepropionase-like amidohydrolase
MKRLLKLALLPLSLFGAFLSPTAFEQSSPSNKSHSLAFVGAKIYQSPTAAPIVDGIVLVKDGRILAVGENGKVKVPDNATRIDCTGLTMTAAFWNSHVHFTEPKWRSPDTQPAGQLAENLRAMFTRYGFVRVLDTGSWLKQTLAIRRRIETGEVVGPGIMTTGSGFAPKGASPFYILPDHLPELSTPLDAEKMVSTALDEGADAIKLFTGSWATKDSIVAMAVDVVRAATVVAHRRGKLVIAHPSNSRGAQAAVDGGVDILAHTFPHETDGPWNRSLIARMSEARMGLVPTLKLWKSEAAKFNADSAFIDKVEGIAGEQVFAFSKVGGQILFGTDVGYMTDYDPTDEYVFMQRAGLSFQQILASLTTAPAERFKASKRSGMISSGMDADLVLLAGDPATDIKAFSNVRYTRRQGQIIYQSPPNP